MTVLTKKCNISTMTVSRAVRLDLGYKSYALKVRHLLTEPQKVVSLQNFKKVLSSLKSTGGHVRFFSDEKIFTVDRTINGRNDCWICVDPADVTASFTTKHPASIMVLGVISSNGDVMPPHFFKSGEKVNKEVFLNVLQTVVVP